MSLILDVDRNLVYLWVDEKDKYREANVVYALRQLTWFENRIGYYAFKWYDIYLAKYYLSEKLGFHLDLTHNFFNKLKSWEEHLHKDDSGVRFRGEIQLRPYQHRGVLYCRARQSSFIGHQMGIGKTHIAIGAGLDKLVRGDSDHCLVVCPASVKEKWIGEITRNVHLNYSGVTEIGGTDSYDQWLDESKWHVVSYAKIRSEIDVLKQVIQDHGTIWKKNLLIADEFHYVRRKYTYKPGFSGKQYVQQTQAVQQLARWSTGTIGLTGQAFRALEHLYEMSQTLDPELFGTWKEFSTKYIVLDNYYRVLGYKDEEEIAIKLPIIMTAYERKDVLPELDPLTFETKWIDLNKSEIDRYKKYVTTGLYEDKTKNSDKRKQKTNPLTIQMNIKRYLGSPQLINDEWPKAGSKLKELKNLLSGNNQKVVIFSQYADVCDIIYDALGGEKNCYKYCRNAKSSLWRDYLTQDEKLYFVMSTKGQVGIDLHGIRFDDGTWKPGASILIMYDELLDPADNDQVYGRIHRYIDDKEEMEKWKAFVIRLRCKCTFEQKFMAKTQEERAEFAKLINSGQLSYSDIKELF